MAIPAAEHCGGQAPSCHVSLVPAGGHLSNRIEPQSYDWYAPEDVGYSWLNFYFRSTVLSPPTDCVWGTVSPGLISIQLDQSLTPAPSVFS